MSGEKRPSADGTSAGGAGGGTEGARRRLALAQTALLSALVAGTPVPPGFDPARMKAQKAALAAKRANVVARIAPELPRILGDGYRPAFLRHAHRTPMDGGYRHDALAFARDVLGRAELTRRQRGELAQWLYERSGPAPRRGGRIVRLLAGLRTVRADRPARRG